MTEAEWLTCADPRPMLKFVPNPSERRARLFAVAVLTTSAVSDTDRAFLTRLEVAEGFADGRVPLDVLRTHWRGQPLTWPERAREWAHVVADGPGSHYRESSEVAHLLRDVFGNPFRTVAFSPEWRTDTVVSL